MAKERYADESARVLESLDDSKTRKVQVVGKVVDGRIEIDTKSIEDFTRKFPDANVSFVAVNAPFNPVQSPAILSS